MGTYGVDIKVASNCVRTSEGIFDPRRENLQKLGLEMKIETFSRKSGMLGKLPFTTSLQRSFGIELFQQALYLKRL